MFDTSKSRVFNQGRYLLLMVALIAGLSLPLAPAAASLQPAGEPAHQILDASDRVGPNAPSTDSGQAPPEGLTAAEWTSIREQIRRDEYRYTWRESGDAYVAPSQLGKFDPGDGDSTDFFGASVAVSGDTIVVGAYYDEDPNGNGAGSAYVFERGGGWGDSHANQVAKLDPDDGDSEDYFGYSVAVSGDTIVVGAYQDEDPNGSHAGSAYVFKKGTGWSDGHANQVAKLDPDDGDSDDWFGWSVAVSGDTIVVGALYDEDPNGSYAGSAYVFEKGAGWSDGHANQVAKLDPDDGDSNDNFGYSMAVSGDTVVVGAYYDEDPNGSEAGSAYVFERGGGWGDGHVNQAAKLDPDDGDSKDNFGYSVAVSGDTIVVGAKGDEDPNDTYAGSVYVFERGSGWSDGHTNQAAKLDPDDGDCYDRFGCSVAVSGATIIVGAYYDEDPNGNGAGSAYVFERWSGWSDGHANQVAKFDPDDGDSDDYFGYSVAVSGDTIVVGALYDEDPNGHGAGSAYVFTPTYDLSIVKSVTPTTPVLPGTTVIYTLAFFHTGSVTTTNVVITDVAPSSMLPGSLSFSSSGAAITAIGSISYVWDVEDLGAGEWGVITITGVLSGSLPVGHVFTNTATITASTPESDAGNNSSSVTVTVRGPLSYFIYLPLVLRNS